MVGFVQVVANVSSAIAVDRVGRRVLLILSEALMAASLASLALYFHLRDDRGIQVSPQFGHCELPMYKYAARCSPL